MSTQHHRVKKRRKGGKRLSKVAVTVLVNSYRSISDTCRKNIDRYPLFSNPFQKQSGPKTENRVRVVPEPDIISVSGSGTSEVVAIVNTKS